MTTEPAVRRPTRAVVMTTLLASLAAIGLFAPLATTTIIAFGFGALTNGSFDSLGHIAMVAALVLAWTPVVWCVITTGAAMGMYRGGRRGIQLGRLAGGLLLVGVPFRVLTWADADQALDGPIRIAIAIVGQQVFITPPFDAPELPGGIGVVTLVTAGIGIGILAGLAGVDPMPVAEPGSAAEPGAAATRVPRRLGIASALLVVLAIDALIPIVVLLAALVFPWRFGASFGASHAAADTVGGVTGAGIVLLGVPCLVAATLAAAGTRAIVRRRPSAPYLAPVAAGVGALWATPWLLFLVAAAGSESLAEAPFVQLALLIALFGLPILAFVVIAWATISTRTLFPLPIAARLIRRPSRRGFAVAGLVGAIAVALVVVLPGSPRGDAQGCVDNCPVEEYETAWFGDRPYQRHSAVAIDDPTPIGVLEDWTVDLPIADATAYGIAGIDPEMALVVRSSDPIDERGRLLDHLLLVSADSDVGDEIMLELCDALRVEGDAQPGGLCGPPDWISFDGREYYGNSAFAVPAAVLTNTGLEAEGKFGPWHDEAERVVYAIAGVDREIAVAMLVDAVVSVYTADLTEVNPTLPAALCEWLDPHWREAGEVPDECRN